MSSSTLPNLLVALAIPQDFSRFDKLTDEQILAQLIRWKNGVSASLMSLRDLLATRHGIQSLPVDEQADIAASVAAFDGPGEWIADNASSLALCMTPYDLTTLTASHYHHSHTRTAYRTTNPSSGTNAYPDASPQTCFCCQSASTA
jgi:hypothetical protein